MTLEQAFEHSWLKQTADEQQFLKSQYKIQNVSLKQILTCLNSYRTLKKDLIWLIINLTRKEEI